MSPRSWSTRCAFWAVAAALLLKAAVPLFATVAAQAQGRTLIEICTVYGVATVVLDEAQASPGAAGDAHDDTVARHGGDHCVLAALQVLTAAASAVSTPALTSDSPTLDPPAHGSPRRGLDKTLLWAARLEHGPPSLA